jgi:hypothetical protein
MCFSLVLSTPTGGAGCQLIKVLTGYPMETKKCPSLISTILDFWRHWFPNVSFNRNKRFRINQARYYQDIQWKQKNSSHVEFPPSWIFHNAGYRTFLW